MTLSTQNINLQPQHDEMRMTNNKELDIPRVSKLGFLFIVYDIMLMGANKDMKGVMLVPLSISQVHILSIPVTFT